METLTREHIDRLTPPERLLLIGELWDSLSGTDWPLPPAQRTELERRLASFDQDRAEGIGWQQLKAELTHSVNDQGLEADGKF